MSKQIIPRDPETILQLAELPYLNREQTAGVLGVSIGTLEVEIRSGRLEVLRVGGRGRRVLIPRAARDRWAETLLGAWKSINAS